MSYDSRQHARADIQLFAAPTVLCGESVTRSSGTFRVDSDVGQFAYYEQGSVLPKTPWRYHEEIDSGSDILGLGPPTDRHTSIWLLDFSGHLTPGRLAEIRSAPDDATPFLLGLAAGVCDIEGQPQCLGLKHNLANLRTVTVSRDLRKFIGLHVDNWDHFSFTKREESRNRICFNVGLQPRYFLFLPVSLSTIYREAVTDGWFEDDFILRPTRMARLYMYNNPNIPAVRCRVAPGQAYVAPTEMLIHDGSTVGAREPDAAITFLGRFDRKPTLALRAVSLVL